jgi:hypothetical protein
MPIHLGMTAFMPRCEVVETILLINLNIKSNNLTKCLPTSTRIKALGGQMERVKEGELIMVNVHCICV